MTAGTPCRRRPQTLQARARRPQGRSMEIERLIAAATYVVNMKALGGTPSPSTAM
ncbi:MAG: hypothetical protein ACLS3M_10080 [Collinsella sp.]